MPDNITDLIGQITDPDVIKQILENATSKYHELSENDWDALAQHIKLYCQTVGPITVVGGGGVISYIDEYATYGQGDNPETEEIETDHYLQISTIYTADSGGMIFVGDNGTEDEVIDGTDGPEIDEEEPEIDEDYDLEDDDYLDEPNVDDNIYETEEEDPFEDEFYTPDEEENLEVFDPEE